MIDNMRMVTNLEIAQELLKIHYKKKYPKCDGVDVHYYLDEKTESLDCDYDVQTYTVYPLCAQIDIIYNIGDISTRAGVLRDNKELANELKEELALLYNTDEYELSFVIVPHFRKKEIKLDEPMTLIFKKIKQKVLSK